MRYSKVGDTGAWVRRERFNHLVAELSGLADRHIDRYSLWLRLHELGLEPETLSHRQVLHFCDSHLEEFLVDHGLTISRRGRRKLLRILTRDEPIPPVPDESLTSKLE
jgi:hypothetical protein